MSRLLIGLLLLISMLSGPVQAEPVVVHPDFDFSPTVSADGRWLAYVSNRSGNRDIWIQEQTPGNTALARQLTDHPGADEQPSLDPTGARLLYVSHEQDPRGDIVLMDLKTRTRERLTDRAFGEQSPLWLPEGKGFLFTRQAAPGRPVAVLRRMLGESGATVQVEGAATCTPTVGTWLVCSREGRLIALRAAGDGVDQSSLKNLTLGPEWDLEPRFLAPDRLIFTRVSPEDDSRSAVWMARFTPEQGLSALYRLTPEGDSPRHPAVAGEAIWFGDARDGEIHRLEIPTLLADYTDPDRAREKGFALLAAGKSGEGMRILENLFLNPERVPEAERFGFDWEYLDLLLETEALDRALAVVERYRRAGGESGARAAIQGVVVPMSRDFPRLGADEARARLVQGLEAIEGIARGHPKSEAVGVEARIAASRLLLLGGETAMALARLNGLESLQDRDARVRALLARMRVLERVGDGPGRKQILLQVIGLVGEKHRWGERAVARLVALAEEGGKFPRQIESLQALMQAHPGIGRLAVAAWTRIATLHQENGDEERCVAALEALSKRDALTLRERIRAIGWKAERLIRLEDYDRAAAAYAELRGVQGLSEAEAGRAATLEIRQRVRAARRLAELGDPKVALKRLTALLVDHPESVEAHRAHIALRVRMQGAAPVVAHHEAWLKEDPKSTTRRYALALALTYVEPLDHERLIGMLEAVVAEAPDVAAHHQTLAWVHEQFERSGKGERGHLEKALQGYTAALRLTDAATAPQDEADLLLNLGHVHHAMRNHGEAFRYWQRWTQRKRPLADPVAHALLYRKMGESAFKTDRSQEAAQYYRLALDLLPADRTLLRVELTERLALVQQTLGEHARAALGFAKALEMNLAGNRTGNLALLQRNIAFNLHQATRPASTPEEAPVDREAVRAALAGYLQSLELLKKHGKEERPPEKGWFSLQLALGENGSQAALGFDQHGEEKLLFGLVSTLHQALDAPERALADLERKRALLESGGVLEGGTQKAELAVVLNRLGQLHHRLKQFQSAWERTLESLTLTESLHLQAGSRANLYNLSKIAVERILAGEAHDPGWGVLLADRLAAPEWEQTQPKLAFFTLANVAFLLAQPLDGMVLPKGGSEAGRMARWHGWLTARGRCDGFYRRAEALLHADKGFGARELWSHQLRIQLNRLVIAQEAGKEEAAARLRGEIDTLSTAGLAEGGWIVALLEAEGSADSEFRNARLDAALAGALDWPAPLHPRGAGRILAPFYERLIALRVERRVGEGHLEAALDEGERLERMRLALLLNDRLGRGFFLNGLERERGAIEELLRGLEAVSLGRRRVASEAAWKGWREAIAGLRESHPEAAGWLSPREPARAAYAETSERRPYVRYLPGAAGGHLFTVTGPGKIRHARVEVDGRIRDGESSRFLIAGAEWLHAALPEGIEGGEIARLVATVPVARVSGLEDLVVGDPRRGVWSGRLATSGPLGVAFDPSPDVPPRRVAPLVYGAEPEPSNVLIQSNVFMSLLPVTSLALPVPGKDGDRIRLSLADFRLAEGHGALLVTGSSLADGRERALLEAALRRAGFAHGILVDAGEKPELVERVWRDYLVHLARMPALLALETAWKGSGEKRANPFRFSGHAGWDGEGARERFEAEVAESGRLREDGKPEAAVGRIENALALAGRAGREGEIGTLTGRAVALWSGLGEDGRAAEVQGWWLERLKAAGTSGDTLAHAHHVLGVLLARQERYEAAMPHLDEAMRLWEQHGEGARPGALASGEVARGVVAENRGLAGEALHRFELALELDGKRRDRAAMAEHHSRLGRIHLHRLYRPAPALQAFGQAVGLYEALGDRIGEGRARLEIVQARIGMGELEAAGRELDIARRLAEASRDGALEAEVALREANIAWYRGAYQTALQALERVEPWVEKRRDPRLTIQLANSRGLIYWSLNEPDLAARHLDAAIDLSQKRNLTGELAASLNNRGLIERQSGDTAAALASFQRALALDEARHDKHHMGNSLRNIGITQLKARQLPEAEATLRRAEALARETGDRILLAKGWLALAQLGRVQGHVREALKGFERTAELSNSIGLAEVRWRALTGAAGALRSLGRDGEALDRHAEAIRVVEGLRAPLEIDTLRHGFLEDKQELYRDMIVLLADRGREREAFDLLERSRSGEFQDLLASGSAIEVHPEDEARLRQVNAMFAEVESRARALAALKGTEAKLWADYRAKRAEAEEALVSLRVRSPGLAARVAVAPVTLERLERVLPAGVGVASYFVTEKELFIWFSRASGTRFKRVPVSEARLEETLRVYRDAMQNQARVDGVLTRLHGWLIEPLAEDLEGVTHLGIIPHRSLHVLAFAALRAPEGWLIDRFPIFHEPSAALLERALSRPMDQKVGNGRVLAIGNPDLGDADFDLAMAEFEAESVRGNFTEGDLLKGKRATKGWILEHIGDYSVIHIAAHGDFQNINPLFSSLWLASGDKPGHGKRERGVVPSEAGRLSAREVAGLPIRAELVTLSACQTGLGQLRGSELLGLNRAFLYAGTRSVLSSLWRVDDLATALLMKHFYRYHGRMGKAEALRQAQLLVRQAHAHPANWAGFALVGEYR
ncbi:Tol-Pal system protein TolB [Candidatus Magnetaquicoccaceae bacterium FCR-1]|uniref:Tol-Pal system protein TolB n=1 Tax=Candidatus Magnetaquiglobus chichijimensis TaxID=3141448 RepID=A0ABQ0C4K8_9PROT